MKNANSTPASMKWEGGSGAETEFRLVSKAFVCDVNIFRCQLRHTPGHA